jgi:hypothetical protein
MAMSNGFSVALFFFFLTVVTLLSCPVTGRNYRTGNAINIKGNHFIFLNSTTERNSNNKNFALLRIFKLMAQVILSQVRAK